MANLEKTLITSIQNNELIPLIGAGVSMSIKDNNDKFIFPSWEGLLKNASKAIQDENSENYLPYSDLIDTFIKLKDYHQAADNAFKGLNSNWHEFITKQFDPSFGDINESYKELPKSIWNLSNRLITLNYDKVFQWASPNNSPPSVIENTAHANLPTLFDKQQNNKNNIWHLHGHVDNTSKLVLTSDSYKNLYTTNESTLSTYQSALEALKTIARTNNILFIGCSLDDIELLTEIEKQNEIFSGNGKKHYALVRESEQERFLDKTSKLNINLITYSDFGQPLIDKINELSSYKDNITSESSITEIVPEKKEIPVVISKIAYLSAQPIDKEIDHTPILKELKKIPFEIDHFHLSINNLNNLDEYDYIFISSTTVKNRITIEKENLTFGRISYYDLIDNIGNPDAKGIFVFTDKPPESYLLKDIDKPLIILPLLNENLEKKYKDKFQFKIFKQFNLDFYKESKIVNIDKVINPNSLNFKINNKINHNKTIFSHSESNRKTFIGRVSELKSIIDITSEFEYDDDSSFLTLLGAGGLGKTTLACKFAHEMAIRGHFNKKMAFINCEPLISYDLFKYQISAIFQLEKANDFLYELENNHEYHDRSSYLLIFDNFEPLLNTNDKIEILNLLDKLTKYFTIIITSRETLKLDNEKVLPIRQMTLPEATELFLKLSKKNNYSSYDLNIIKHDIVDRILDKNPLAITIITSSFCSGKSISRLAEELESDLLNITDDDLVIFDNSSDVNIERKRSLYGSIQYSYSMLNNEEKKAFEKLSLFPDGINMDGFQHLFSNKGNNDVISNRIIKSLQNKSLIENINGHIKLQSIISRFSKDKLDNRDYDSSIYNAVFNYNSRLTSILNRIFNSSDLEKEKEMVSVFSKNQNNIIFTLSSLKKFTVDNIDKLLFINDITMLSIGLPIKERIIAEIENNYSDFNDKEKEYIDIQLFSYNHLNNDFKDTIDILNRKYNFDYIESLEKESNRLSDININNLLMPHINFGHSSKYVQHIITNKRYSSSYDFGLHYSGILSKELANVALLSITKLEVLSQLDSLDLNLIDEALNAINEGDHFDRLNIYFIKSLYHKLSLNEIESLVSQNNYTLGIIYLMKANIGIDPENNYILAINLLEYTPYPLAIAIYFYARFLYRNNSLLFEDYYNKGYEITSKHCYMYLSYLFENIKPFIKKSYIYESNSIPGVDGVKLDNYIAKTIAYITKN